ncbi:hypothetical protein TrRE_jg9328, partial [Triparma retinervis]
MQRLNEALQALKIKRVQRGCIKGELRVSDFEFGQSAITLVGTVEAKERIVQNFAPKTQTWAKGVVNSLRRTSLIGNGGTFSSDGASGSSRSARKKSFFGGDLALGADNA